MEEKSTVEAGGTLHVVRSVIKRFGNELISMAVPYAINAKKVRLCSMHPWFLHPVTVLLLVYPACSILSRLLSRIFFRKMSLTTAGLQTDNPPKLLAADKLIGTTASQCIGKSNKTGGGEEETQYSRRKAENEEYDSETASIKQRIENSREKLNSMNVVATVNAPVNFGNSEAVKRWAINMLRHTGFQIDRLGFGKIYFSEKKSKILSSMKEVRQRKRQ